MLVDALLYALILGLSSAGLTTILRYAPLINKAVAAGMKPWSCDVCMTLWTTLLFFAAFFYLFKAEALFIALMPGFTVGKYALSRVRAPASGVFKFPDLPPELKDES